MKARRWRPPPSGALAHTSITDHEVRSLRRRLAGDVCACRHTRERHYTSLGSTGPCIERRCPCHNYALRKEA